MDIRKNDNIDYLVRKLNSEIAKQDSNTLNHVELSSMHNSSLKVGEISEFREKLKNYSVNEVKELIEIIEKGSLHGAFFGKYDLIHNIIFNQPHNTEEFSEYSDPKSKIIKKAYKNNVFSLFMYGSLLGLSLLATVFISSIFISPVNFQLSLGIWAGLSFIGFFPISYLTHKKELKLLVKNKTNMGEMIYGIIRHGVSMEEYEKRLLKISQEEERKNKIIEKQKKHAELVAEKKRLKKLESEINLYGQNFNSGLKKDFQNVMNDMNSILSQEPTIQNNSDVNTSGNSYVSMNKVASMFNDAKNTIMSYELDILKAVKYPAFNDITVPEVREMHLLFKDAEYAIDSKNHEQARQLVNKLTLAVKAAEQTAMRTSWNNMSKKEQSDLKLAENLIKQVNDSGNTDEFRANLYQRLRTVVNRLNSHHVIVPNRAVLHIEEQGRKQLSQ